MLRMTQKEQIEKILEDAIKEYGYRWDMQTQKEIWAKLHAVKKGKLSLVGILKDYDYKYCYDTKKNYKDGEWKDILISPKNEIVDKIKKLARAYRNEIPDEFYDELMDLIDYLR